MLSRGKIAWLGVLLLGVLVTFRGENVLYRVWTTRNALATEERKDQRSNAESELAALPAKRSALVAQKTEVDAALSALIPQQASAVEDSRQAQRRKAEAQRAHAAARSRASQTKTTLIKATRALDDGSMTVGKLLNVLRSGSVQGLPSVLSPFITSFQEAQTAISDAWAKQQEMVADARDAMRISSKLQSAVTRLRQQSASIARQIAALDRRKVLLERRIAVLSRPRTVLHAAAPVPTAITLKASATLSGAVGDSTTPLVYKDLSKDQVTLDGFLSDRAKAQKKLDWPVSPEAEGISAYYHDELYKAKMGQDHFALDIVADQGTEIVSPADGLVLKAEDSGTGFQYILVLHKNGYLTFYGHVSAFNVAAGDLVRRGAILGKTGGKPGTVGAGSNTTGPHLHLEVWKNNKRLDPLLYLDQGKLPTDPVKVDPDQIPSATAADLDR